MPKFTHGSKVTSSVPYSAPAPLPVSAASGANDRVHQAVWLKISKSSCAYARERVMAYPELPPQRLGWRTNGAVPGNSSSTVASTDAGVLSCPPPTMTITQSDHGSKGIGLDSLLTILVK